MRCRLECRLAAVVLLALVAAVFLLPVVSRRLLPEPTPEQPNLHIQGTAPRKFSPQRELEILIAARRILAAYPEVESIYSTTRLLDEKGDPTRGYHLFVEMRPNDLWPALIKERSGARPRTRAEFIEAVKAGLEAKLPGISWTFEPAGTITCVDAPLPRARPRAPATDPSGQELPNLDRVKAMTEQLNNEPDY
jgi:heavy metal efflux system protein